VGSVTEDVVLQGESTQDEKNVAAPLGVVGGLKIKNDGNQILDVLDGGGLAVQVSNSCSFGGGVVVVVDVFIPSAKTFAEGGSLPLQSIGGRTLRIEGGSGHADAFLGGGGGLQKVSLLLELLTALRVGGAQGGGFVFESLGGGERFIAERGRGGGRSAGVGGTGLVGSHGSSGREEEGRAQHEGRAAAEEREARAAAEKREARGRRGGKRKVTGPD
jgi:hypothetical protein